MGLELAELAMEIEERYAIELGVDEWKDVRTFGDLVDSVKRIIDRSLDPPVEESRHEIILQSLLAELRLRLPKDVEINEETRLKKLRPFVKRYEIWSLVQQRFPELPTWNSMSFRRMYYVDKPTFLGFLCVVIAWAVIFGIVSEAFGGGIRNFLVAGSICLGIGLVWLFWIAGRLPHRTVGDVAQAIAEKRQKLLKAREYSALDIENDLSGFMIEAFGLHLEKVQREHDLVKDLGLG